MISRRIFRLAPFNNIFLAILLLFFIDIKAQDFVWAKSINGTGTIDAEAIKPDNSGNLYSIGAFTGTIDFDPGVGMFSLTTPLNKSAAFVLKLDSEGNFLWVRTFGNSNFISIKSIDIDKDGNVYTCGFFNNVVDFDPGLGTFNLNSSGLHDIFLSKLDKNGNFIWAKKIGGAGQDESNSIALDKNLDIFLTGNFSGTVDFDPGSGVNNLNSSFANNEEIYVLKLNNNGDFVWARKMGETNKASGKSIAVGINGDVYLGASYIGNIKIQLASGASFIRQSQGYDILYSKLNTNGNVVWAQAIGGSNNDACNAIVLDENDNLYTTGFYSGNVDFDGSSSVFTLDSIGQIDIYVSKIDAAGNFLWAKKFGGKFVDRGQAIAIDSNGDVYCGGRFTGIADFNPSEQKRFNLRTHGKADAFICNLNNAGDFSWAKSFGSTENDECESMAIEYGKRNLFVLGNHIGVVDFNSPKNYMLGLENQKAVYIVKYKTQTLPLEDDSFVIYPNPTNEDLYIDLNAPFDFVEITILNSLGQVLKTEQYQSIWIINTSIEYEKGLYFVNIRSGKKSANFKIIKQ